MARTRGKTDRQGAWRALLARLSLPEMEAWSNTVRTLFLNALFLLAVVVVVPILVGQFRRDQVIIEPIAVPETLADQGLTPEVVASRVWDGLSDVEAAAKTSKEKLSAIPDARRVQFSFPDSGFSIESLVFHVRKLFNAYETRIAGEFVCGDTRCEREGMRLRLRVIRDDVKLVDLPPIGAADERGYFRDAAAAVLAELDPFTALAATAQTQPLKATILARRLIRSRHADAKWAHNLIGTIRVDEMDYKAAIGEFRAALELDADFKPSLANLGNALARSGDAAGAREEFDRLKAIDPRNVLAAEGLADLALAAGDPDGAVKQLMDAAEWDPLSPRYYAKAGKIELDAGHRQEGEALLTRALEIDPGYLPAFAFLAAQHLARDDYAGAERLYRDAADYAPDDAEAQMSEGRILAILHRCDDAIPRFQRAVTLAPQVVDHRRQLAECQVTAGKPEQALETVAAALALDPTNADLYMIQANGLRDLGRKPEAVAAYRKFLEFDRQNSVMRPVAEKFIELLSAS
ncbi:MAG: tetratricopeptide repeat protein [Rhizobiales bacterium]|nr:tetratricopeptide repeat protein [Hyphomicrobiales bacterium]